jgi:AraC-like DNA-binding protein
LAAYDERKLAAQRQITLRQLQRQFHRELGRTPEAWLIELRMLDARQLLLEARQIKEVPFRLGVKHGSHFFRKFKETYGMTPLQFVRRHNGFPADVAVEHSNVAEGEQNPVAAGRLSSEVIALSPAMSPANFQERPGAEA